MKSYRRRTDEGRVAGAAVLTAGCMMMVFYALILVALGIGVYWLWGQVV